MFIHAHRQAWCWQDEYCGLTMDDIRRLEVEAAKELAQRFASVPNESPTPASKKAASAKSKTDDGRLEITGITSLTDEKKQLTIFGHVHLKKPLASY